MLIYIYIYLYIVWCAVVCVVVTVYALDVHDQYVESL